jgi:Ser/Thr protein kinase RdoA (MazF antagonist)
VSGAAAAGPPLAILHAYGWERARLEPISIGLINRTFRVVHDERRFILQRLHPVFAPEVNLDIEVITSHLASRGVTTPRLVRTLAGEAFELDEESRPWRALSFVEGRCESELRTPALARAAGAMAGRFARATADLEHRFAFTRAGVHDTAKHLARLEAALADGTRSPAPELDDARELAREILAHARTLPPLGGLPVRIVHGDLKASNILFAHDRDEAICLVDLDTMAHGSVATEMGDALRSWTNPRGEDDARGAIDLGLFAAALEGYLSEARALLTEDELECFPAGLETIALELASRFCLDVFEDRYFGWDARRYASRRAHNLVRVGSQLALARSARERRGELAAVVASLR